MSLDKYLEKEKKKRQLIYFPNFLQLGKQKFFKKINFLLNALYKNSMSENKVISSNRVF